MNGITPNFNIGEMFGVKPTEKGSSSQNNSYTGPSFAENLSEIAKSAGIRVGSGNNAAAAGLQKQKEEKIEKLFSFGEAEEEQLDESLTRIAKLLKKLRD
jgi:hypothetical protein